MKFLIFLLILFFNFIFLINADSTKPFNITQNNLKFILSGEQVYIKNNSTLLVNNKTLEDSFYTSKSEGQLVFTLPDSYCGNVKFELLVNITTRSTIKLLQPTYSQIEYPFTNNGSSLSIKYYYSTCSVKFKTISSANVNNESVKCNVNGDTNIINCQLSKGSGYKNFSATINSDGKDDINNFVIRYANLIITDQLVTFNKDKNTQGTMTYYGYNFGNSSSKCVANFIKANFSMDCISNSTTLTINVAGENTNKKIENSFNNLRGLVDISIDDVVTRHYFIICKITSYDRNASNLVTDGGYMIFKGILFEEANDKTKGVDPLTTIIQARFKNVLYTYICNVTLTGNNTDTLNVTIPPGIGNGTMLLYYENFFFRETPMNYTVIYTPSNDSNKMTINIVYSVIIVLGFFTILILLVHNINPIREKLGF